MVIPGAIPHVGSTGRGPTVRFRQNREEEQ
jgi:hypothetical protein